MSTLMLSHPFLTADFNSFQACVLTADSGLLDGLKTVSIPFLVICITKSSREVLLWAFVTVILPACSMLLMLLPTTLLEPDSICFLSEAFLSYLGAAMKVFTAMLGLTLLTR